MMGLFGTKAASAPRVVYCTHCNRQIDVCARAMSVFCPHCRQRVILEDYTIRSYHAVQSFRTCGDVVVERRGTLSAPIRVSTIKVKGKVWGNVEARERVEVARTGLVRGSVRAPYLIVQDGGVIVGRCEIGSTCGADAGV